MDSGNDIKANLNICIQTHDFQSFTSILKLAKIHYTSLKDHGGFNIFHDLSSSLINESLLLEFLTILVNQFFERYQQDSISIIQQMLNAQSIRDKLTPLLQAVKNNRRV